MEPKKDISASAQTTAVAASIRTCAELAGWPPVIHSVVPNRIVKMPQRMYPMPMKFFRFPIRSDKVPNRKVAMVVAMAEMATIQEMMVGSLAILAYTKVLNHWFSMFQHSCPTRPRPQTSTQKRISRVRFFSISDCPFSFVCGFIVFYKSNVVNRFLFGQNDVSAFYRIGTKNAGITGIPAFSSIYVEEAQPAGDSSSCLTVMEDTL